MTRILIVDDQLMIRAGLRSILESRPDFQVDDVADGLAALDMLTAQPYEVVLMDIRMPGIDGVETTRRLRSMEDRDNVRIIVLTTFENDQNVLSALQAGANGFLGKGVSPTELLAGIDDVVAGGGALSGRAKSVLIAHVAEDRRVIDPLMVERFAQLTGRERDIVTAVTTGKSNAEIADELFLSPFTVKTHANRAMAKVGARDRAQLVAFAYQAGLDA